MNRLRPIALLLTSCAVVACSPTPTTTPATSPAQDASTKLTTSSTGVIDCDLYLQRLRLCMEKASSPDDRALIRHGIEQTQAQWARLTDRQLLATQCKALLAAVKPPPGQPDDCRL